VGIVADMPTAVVVVQVGEGTEARGMNAAVQSKLFKELPPIVKCPRCRGKAHKSARGMDTYRCRRCRIDFDYVGQAEPKKRGAE
jgi:rubredoxin